jgi:hypothetical protein
MWLVPHLGHLLFDVCSGAHWVPSLAFKRGCRLLHYVRLLWIVCAPKDFRSRPREPRDGNSNELQELSPALTYIPSFLLVLMIPCSHNVLCLAFFQPLVRRFSIAVLDASSLVMWCILVLCLRSTCGSKLPACSLERGHRCSMFHVVSFVCSDADIHGFTVYCNYSDSAF